MSYCGECGWTFDISEVSGDLEPCDRCWTDVPRDVLVTLAWSAAGESPKSMNLCPDCATRVKALLRTCRRCKILHDPGWWDRGPGAEQGICMRCFLDSEPKEPTRH
jgi:hypothetical protein